MLILNGQTSLICSFIGIFMKKEYKKKADELRKTLLQGNIDLIKKSLEKMKNENGTAFEEEILEGVRYANLEEYTGYEFWNFVPNEFFTLSETDDQTPENTGSLWFALIAVVGNSGCRTAVELRKNIKSLNLFGMNLPELPREIGNFTELTELVLNNCLQSAFFPSDEPVPEVSFPAELGNLKKLKSLDMGQNAGVRPPKEISGLQNLEKLILSSCLLNEFPEEICELKKLQRLILDNNSFTSLPESIGNLTELLELNLTYNRLTELPSEIGRLKKLEILEIGGNPVSSLPEEMRSLSNLKTLSLYDHCLTSFPSVLKDLENLKDMETAFTPWIENVNISEVLQDLFGKEAEEADPRIKVLNLGNSYPKAAAVWKNKIACSSEEEIFLFDSDSLEEIWSDDAPGISLISFSADGKFFICVSDNGFIRRYNVSQKNAKLKWEAETENMPVSLCISRDSRLFAVCHQDMKGFIWIRKCSDGTLVKKFGNTDDDGPYEGYGYSGLVFSADGRTVYAADQDWSRVRCWTVKTGEDLTALTEDGVQFCSVDCSADGSYLFTGAVETPGSVWSPGNNEKIMNLNDEMGMTRTVAAHPSKDTLLCTGAVSGINVWDVLLQKKTEEFLLPEGNYSINSLSFSEDNFICALILYQGYEKQKTGSSFLALAYLSENENIKS